MSAHERVRGEDTLRRHGRPKKYPDELIQRAVRIALEGERPIAHIAHDLRIHPETLCKKVRQAEADSGTRPELLATQIEEVVLGIDTHLETHTAVLVDLVGRQVDAQTFPTTRRGHD